MPQRPGSGETPAGHPADSGVDEHRSLGLEPVLRLLERRRCRILDLGPAIGANVGYFSAYNCKLFIGDLYRSMRSQRSRHPADPEALRRTLAGQLPESETRPFDLILAWDLLNYLEPEEIGILGGYLEPLCRPSGLLFAMIWTRRAIPHRPLDFEISGRTTLLYRRHGEGSRPGPRYKEPDLGRLLAGFAVEASYLLRNGVQEYLFVRRTAGAPAAR